jgi:phospho-N-acetylmuramoyl-pentapeptide-transferase
MIAKIFILSFISALGAFIWAPGLVSVLRNLKLWRKGAHKVSPDGRVLENFQKIAKDDSIKTPRGGGLLIWVTVLVVAILISILAKIFNSTFSYLNFLSRAETWLPLFTLVAAGLIGLLDDVFSCKLANNKYLAGGISLKKRIFLVLIIGLVGALWFHFKLGWDTIHIPFLGDFYINGFYIPIFAIIMVAVFSSGVIDGIDGMSGGVFILLYSLFGVIAFMRGQVDLATFCAVIASTLTVFLWFNAPPAKFYLGETGILALTTTLTVIAFLTNSIILLPIAGIMLVVTTGSNVWQLIYRKLTGKKYFLVAPVHHHFQLKGIKNETVVMHYWILTGIGCILALMIYLLDKGL